MKSPTLHFWTSLLCALLTLLPATAKAQDDIELKAIPSSSEVRIGDEFTITVEGAPNDAYFFWSETNKTVTPLERSGNISTYRAKAAGDAEIWVTYRKNIVVAKVKVLAASGKPTPPIKPAGNPDETRPPTIHESPGIDDEKAGRIVQLLDEARTRLASMESQYGPSGNETSPVAPADPALLVQTTEQFFAGMKKHSLTMKDLQAFKERAKVAGAQPGDSILFPGAKSWKDRFQGVERALMAGRTEMVESAWNKTLDEFCAKHPDAAVFGRIDIGSWVKNTLGDLGFESDVDFSSVSIDPQLNLEIKALFEANLKERSGGLNMVEVDAILTAHGQASSDVFVGEWGRTFAELDMLKRSRWSVLKFETKDGKNVLKWEMKNGKRVPVSESKSGSALFWEVALRRSEAGMTDIDVLFPKMTLDMEPMLSMEMLRHGIHDIEHGPFERGQKLIKMLKYVERSYHMNRKALAGKNWNPYKEVDPQLAAIADRLIALKGQKNKVDPSTGKEMVGPDGKPIPITTNEKIAIYEDLITQLADENLSENNIDRVVEKVVARCKSAMIDNATKALAFRLVAIANLENETTRQAAVEKLWDNLSDEVAAYQEGGVPVPDLILQARELANQVRKGQLSFEEMEKRGQELHKLLEDSYKIPAPLIERILPFDIGVKIASALKKFNKMTDDQITSFLNKARTRPTKMGNLLLGIHDMNAQMEKVTNGSKVMSALDTADTVLSLYEGWTSGRDKIEKAKNVTYILARVGASSQNPIFGIPFGLYESATTGNLTPAAMAVGFYFFPFAGQIAMISGHLERLDVALKDSAFLSALGAARELTEFNEAGQIISFKMKNFNGTVIHEETLSKPGDRDEIVEIMQNPERLIATSKNFSYWLELTPRLPTEYGMSRNVVRAQQWVQRWTGRDISGYTQKLEKLRKFFGNNDAFVGRLMMLQHHANVENFPKDEFTPERERILIQMEDELERAIWIAMADALESSVKSATLKPEWEAELTKLEEELSLRDTDMGRGNGLISKVRAAVAEAGSIVTGENPYATGLIYEKYLNTYRRIVEIKKGIIDDLWYRKLGIDSGAAQTASPLKFLLAGGRNGAPQLTADPDTDLQLAQACLGGQMNRTQKLSEDLAAALEREIDPNKDKERVKILGQWALEWEHLLDDAPERNASAATPEVQAALRVRSKAYQDFLDGLRKPKLEITFTGTTTTLPNLPLEFSASVKRPDGKPLPELRYQWVSSTQAAKLKIDGLAGAMTCELTGPVTLTLEVYQIMASDEERLVTSQSHRVEVEYPKAKIQLAGPGTVPAKTQATFKATAECSDEIRPYLLVQWNLDGLQSAPAPALDFSFAPTDAGKHVISANLLAVINGKEFPLDSAQQDFMVSDGSDPDGKPIDDGGTQVAAPPPGNGEKKPGDMTDGPNTPDDGPKVAGFDPKKLNLQLAIKPTKTTVLVGGTIDLSASYSADNYVRQRLKLVWNPDFGTSEYVQFKAEKPGTYKISLTAYLPVKEVPVKVGEAEVEIVVVAPSSITAPAQVLATDFFDVSVNIPAELKSQTAHLWWSGYYVFDDKLVEIGSYKPTTQTSVKMQTDPRPRDFSSAADGKITALQFGATLCDAAGKELDKASATVSVVPASISSKGADVWEGGAHEKGFTVNRKKATRKRKEGDAMVESASVGGTIKVLWETTFLPKNMEELKQQVENAAIWASLPPAGASNGKIATEPFSIGDWKGYIKKTTQVVTRYNGNPYGYVDLGYPQAGVSGYAMLMKGRIAITISYSAGGTGTALGQGKLWWDDMPFVTTHTATADGEIQAILGSLKISADPKFETFPYEGPKLDGSDLPQPLEVELTPPDKPLFPGQTVDLTATVSGGKPPFTYTWTGDHAGSGATVTFVGSKPGDYKLSVAVVDAANQSAGKEITIKVTGVTATLRDLGKAYYGENKEIIVDVQGLGAAAAPPGDGVAKPDRKPLRPPYSYNAEGKPVNAKGEEVNAMGAPLVMEPGTKFIPDPEFEDIYLEGPAPPAAPTFTAIWQSSPTLAFDPPESSGSTHVTFDRIPPEGVKLWVQIVQNINGVPTTVGESEQMLVQVSPPEFEVTFDPADGKVGQEIKATVTTKPAVEPSLMNFVWDAPASAERMEYNDPGSVIGFRLKNNQPYAIHAKVQVPHHGDLIGEVSATFTGSGYQVKAEVQDVGVRVPIYDPASKSFITPPRGTYCGDERIFLIAHVIGDPQPEGVKWKWTVNEGTTLSNEISQTPTVSRHETGTITAKVEARDKNDILLGEDTINLAVTIPADMVNPLMVTVAADQQKLKSGTTTWVRATAKGGTSPYNYEWKGATGNGSAVQVTAEKAGDQVVGVSVTDDKKKSAAGEVTLTVEPVVLELQITADKPTYKIGETATLAAKASGGSAPYTFAWQAPAAGKESAASWNFLKAGVEEATVNVTDKFGNKGTASIRLNCQVSTATIIGLQPKELHDNTQPLSITTDAAGPYDVTFFSAPEIVFTPASSADGKSIAKFNQPEAVKLWAEVRQRDAQKTLLARSPDYTVEVVDPQFSLVFEAADGTVGSPVFARLKVEPPEARNEAFSLTWSGIKPDNESPAGAGFTPADTSPVTLTASILHAKTQQKLGDATGTYTAKPLSMRVMAPEGTFATGEPVEVKAAFPRNAKVPGALLKWTASNGTTSGLPEKLDATITGTAEGDCTVTVTARSAAGGEIGSGSAVLKFIKPETMGAQSKAQKLVNDGFTLEKAGKLSDAVEKYKAALTITPDAKLQSHVDKMEASLAHMTQAQKLINEGYDLEKAGKLAEAAAKYAAANRLVPDPRLEAKIKQLGSSTGEPEPDAAPPMESGSVVKITPAQFAAAKPIPGVGNVGSVQNGPTKPATFEIKTPSILTYLSTYHYNFGRGKAPGRISIQHGDGTTSGPWEATGRDAQGGVVNGYWDVMPNVLLNPGTYTVLDGDPSTWATNEESGKRGFFELRVLPASAQADGPAALPPGDPSDISHMIDLSGHGGKKGEPTVMRGILVDNNSYIRMKSTDENRLKLEIPVDSVPATAIAISACLDDSTFVPTDTTLTRMTVVTSAGNRTFDLKAGVHASDWNHGEHNQKHALAKEAMVDPRTFLSRFDLPTGAVVTAIQFEYVDPKVDLWFGHAPGFVIKGLTLIKPAPETPSPKN